METIGPAARRNATGPLRRLLGRQEVPRPAPRGRFWAYAVPLGLLALVGLGLSAGQYLGQNRELPGIVIGIMAAGSVLPIALAYRLPVWAWRLAWPMMFLGVINANPREPWPWNTVQIAGFLIVLARFAATQEPGTTAWATGLSLVPVFLYAPDANAWGAALLLVVIAALGDIRYRRRNTRQLEEVTELERARRAVLEERTRIAREMHDVVAHHMSMIAVRAETAPYRLPDLPATAREELAGIASSAREALTDMRRLLGVLRADRTEPAKAPQPSFADVPALIRTARAAGVDATLSTRDISEISDTVGLAAYRIVQEALANAARHAPGHPVTVAAHSDRDHLRITIRNPLPTSDPPPTPAATRGHGITGMRERATILGGSLTATPSGADFVVTATLPHQPLDSRRPSSPHPPSNPHQPSDLRPSAHPHPPADQEPA